MKPNKVYQIVEATKDGMKSFTVMAANASYARMLVLELWPGTVIKNISEAGQW